MKLIMSRFRMGISELSVYHYRYRFVNQQQMLCPLCNESEEDELHFVFICPFFHNLRKQLIPLKYYRRPCMYKLVMLISSRNENIAMNFSIFVYRALKVRNMLIQETTK